jgi:hypothetical protein
VEEKMSSSVREQLFQINPFFSGSAGNPWDNNEPDVPSLNEDAYAHICALIQAQHQNPRTAFAGLVLGEAGMGKTHFLKRLLNYTQQNDIAAIFVSVKPFLNSKKTIRHLLREIVVNLAQVQVPEAKLEKSAIVEKRKQIPQFEYFVIKIMQRYQKDNLGFDIQQAIAYFKRLYPGINANLLQAIFNYRDSSKQGLILNWLEGRIDEDHVSILKFPDREKMNDQDLEEEAHDIIVSMGMLLEYCAMPMVICFDQLDGMRNQDLITAFGDAVFFLTIEVNNMLPLVFARMDIWYQRFSQLDPAVIERLVNNVEHLQVCSLAQAQELIKERIKSKFPNSAEEKFQWLVGQLGEKLKEGYTPRRVIELANNAIVHPFETISEMRVPAASQPEFDIVAFFAEEYRRERVKVNFDFEVWTPDAERLLKALSAYLENRPEYDALQPDGDDKRINLRGKYQKTDGTQIDCAFILNTADHYRTAQVAFESGMKFLRAHPDGACYYITDKRCNFKPSWKKTHEVKNSFEALHGTSLFLEESQAIDWYGLTSLIFKVEAGDVSLPASMGFRAATLEDFARYMKEGFNKNLLEVPSAPPPPPVDGELLEKKIIEILIKSSMQFMAVALLLKELKASDIVVTDDSLVGFIKKRQERFTLYESTDDNLVMLNS